jgi:carboxymethylenebutenolidase
MAFVPQLRKQAEEAFSVRKGKENFVEYEFKDYKGQCNLFRDI